MRVQKNKNNNFATVSRLRDGFSLFEFLMVIAITGILGVIGVTMIADNVDSNRYNATIAQMEELRIALVGDPRVKTLGTRSDFSYVGDLGALPSTSQTLSVLLNSGTLPSWAVDADTGISHGWRGPYIKSSQDLKDFWGRNFIYVNNGTAEPTITSLGADGVIGGIGYNQDITINIPNKSWKATVKGNLFYHGSLFTGMAEVEFSKPNGTASISTQSFIMDRDDNGQYLFENIPFGSRSLTVYIPSKAKTDFKIGPVLVAVDKDDVTVKSSALDFSLEETCAAGIIKPTNLFIARGSQKRIEVRINIDRPVTITHVSVTSSKITFNNFTPDAIAKFQGLWIYQDGTWKHWTCGDVGGRWLSPNCPAYYGQLVRINKEFSLKANSSTPFYVEFDRSMSNTKQMKVRFYYKGGRECDEVEFED